MVELTDTLRLATIVVTISIILSGIALGLGRSLGYRNMENFGKEELGQSIINAALLGIAATIIETTKSISADAVKDTICQAAISEDAIAKISCIQQSLSTALFGLIQENIKTLNIVGYYQTLSLNFGSFSIQPFINLGGVSSTLQSQLLILENTLIMINLNSQFIDFISQNAFGLIFALGLIFRAFFATRKLGGFLIALAIGLFVFYPIFIMAFPTPYTEIQSATVNASLFNNNTNYALIPIVDLNGNNAIAQKLDSLAGRTSNVTNSTMTMTDFSGDLTTIIGLNANAIAKTLLYSVIAPIFSLIITVVFIKELSNILGGEIASGQIFNNL
ncbi:MAG: hypothetical protein Q7S22_08200 [Candidatus Micrarchaeota archaeon]|nr:hypothetical protein [Candidatus Micrarchaeota archaeon]